jgi:ribosomal protein S12 methylthiotransferase
VAAVVREAEGLAAAGVREINVVAQDTTAYGDDTGEADLSQLVTALARVEDLRWIRLLYGYPAGVTEPLIEVMAREDRVCKYLDVPLQHAHPQVLTAMGRSGDGDSHIRLIEGLREAMPDIAIRSTFLVGFPGEGDREFEALLEFLERAQLDRVGAFCYSREAGTPAADMPHQVSATEARRRYDELMKLQQRISLARNERWLGRDLDVLLESPDEGRDQWVGRSFRDAPEVDGTVKVSALDEPSPAGRFVRVRIVGTDAYDLFGRPTEAPAVDGPGTALT